MDSKNVSTRGPQGFKVPLPLKVKISAGVAGPAECKLSAIIDFIKSADFISSTDSQLIVSNFRELLKGSNIYSQIISEALRDASNKTRNNLSAISPELAAIQRHFKTSS